jgi:hypothetical protein
MKKGIRVGIVSSLHLNPKDKIWTGGSNEFGECHTIVSMRNILTKEKEVS